MDKPIGYAADGRPVYDNTPTVVAVLAYTRDGLIMVRRNNEPGKGLLGLPGGYHMRGETWQEAGARELLEETGYRVPAASLRLISLVTDEYGNNLVIAGCRELALKVRDIDPAEVQELIIRDYAGDDSDWAFPRHYSAAVKDLGR